MSPPILPLFVSVLALLSRAVANNPRSSKTALTRRASATQLCNGQAEYCNLIYSNVSQVAAHDSPFIGDLPTQNQHWSLSDQLNHGVRFLQGQTHKNVFEKLNFCHTSCWEEDGGSVSSYLSTIKSFLDNNPDEVLTLLLTNGDNVDPSEFDSAFSAVSGLKDYAFTPSTGSGVLSINDWPTLSAMISSGKRLVVFLDYGADTIRFPYILSEFDYFFETPFDVTDPTFAACNVDRASHAATPMYIVNHYLDVKLFGSDVLIPDILDIERTNAATGGGSIGAQVAVCEKLYPYAPKAVLVDYIDEGDAFAAERAMNKV